MKAIQINNPNQCELVEIDTPRPLEHEVLIQVMASGICGTDIHIFRGEYLGDYPIIPGHEFSGVIEEIGSEVTRFSVGDRVAVEPNIACDNCYNCLNNRHNFCLNWQAIGVTRPGGMAQYVCAPEKAVFDIGSIPFDQGAFMEPLSCVLHGLQRLDASISDKVAILGAGPIGILLLQCIRCQGASTVCVVDKNKFRASFAKDMGADTIHTNLEELSHDYYDVVIDATGSLPVMSKTIDYVRYGGKVLLFGVPPAKQPMSIEAFPIFRKGLTILSSFTSLRNSYQALALIESEQIDLSKLISHKLPLEQFQHGVEIIEQGWEDVKKVIVLPNSQER